MYTLDTDRQVFFYEQEFYVLSNFSAFRLRWRGMDFDTSEHAYQWEKFNQEDVSPEYDPFCQDIQKRICKARSAHEAFKIAEKHFSFLIRPNWRHEKVAVMGQILRVKAQQHEYVRRKLLETGDRELIENSWRDAFWGWGPEQNGMNMLGKLWMEIRTELRKLH